jgi:hypothetical protein
MNIPADYVDVAERIRIFKELYPDGSLQAHDSPRLWKVGDKEFIGYCAAAYRTPDDERPGIGWAWEPVPGPTPFTKDSELMNAETSAWGRAIVALGIPTKKIASSEEVRNRSEPKPSAEEKKMSEGTLKVLKETVAALHKGFPSPDPAHDYWNDVKEFMVTGWGISDSKQLSEAQGQALVLEFEKRLIAKQKDMAEDVPFGEEVLA